MASQNNLIPPPLCATGCGIYASVETKNLCSKCYNEFLKSTLADKFSASLDISAPSEFLVSMLADKFSASLEISAPSDYSTVVMETLPSFIELENGSCSSANTQDSVLAMLVDSSGENKEKTKRCQSCNKRVRLLGFNCRCGQVFCGDHRYPEKHSCPFDYKNYERQLLAAKNPLIRVDKLDRF